MNFDKQELPRGVYLKEKKFVIVCQDHVDRSITKSQIALKPE